MLNLVQLVNFKSMSDSVKLRKKGSLTATAATESTAHAISEYTQTSPATLTAAEVKVYTEISDKAIEFIDRASRGTAGRDFCGYGSEVRHRRYGVV